MRNSGATTRRGLIVSLLVLVADAAPVVGAAKKAQKAIVVSVGQQMLWAYKGNKVVSSSYVSTGRAGFDTPIGSYAVLTKLPSQTMEGVIGGEYYNVRDVTQLAHRIERASFRFPSAAAMCRHSRSRQPARHAPERPAP